MNSYVVDVRLCDLSMYYVLDKLSIVLIMIGMEYEC
jgi:hypothetical protein